MRMRSMLTGWVAIALVAACSQETPAPAPEAPAPEVDPNLALQGSAAISGVVTGPKGYSSKQEILRKLGAFSEEPQAGLVVTTVDPLFRPIAGAATTTTDAQGRFSLSVPLKGGFVLAAAASASAPLVGLFRDGESLTITTAGTLVAGKIAYDLQHLKGAPSVKDLDRAKIDAVTKIVDSDLKHNEFSPDYSLGSWIYALDFFAYRGQGTLAKGLNDLIPGSVGGPMSR